MEITAVENSMNIEQIMDVAGELMCKFGYAGMSMRGLANALGVQAGSLYNHVESKQSLLYELIHRHESGMLNLLKDHALGDSRSAVHMMTLLWDKLALESSRGCNVAPLAKGETHHLTAEQLLEISQLRQSQRQRLRVLVGQIAGEGIGLSAEGLEHVSEELHALLVCHITLDAEPHIDPDHFVRQQLRSMSKRLLLKRD